MFKPYDSGASRPPSASGKNTSSSLTIIPGQRRDDVLPNVTTLPCSHEAERGVLSAIITDPGVFLEAIELGLRAEHFYYPQHAAIYEAIESAFNKNVPLNLVCISEELKAKGRLEQVGDTVFLSELEGLFETGSHLPFYTKIILNKSALRRLIQTTNQIGVAARNEQEDSDTLLEKAEKEILAIRGEASNNGAAKIHTLVANVLKRMENNTGQRVTGVPSGFHDFDNLTCGFQPGELIIIAARPSMGKTAFVLNIAAHIAGSASIPVAFFSLEMSAEQLTQRIIGSEAKIDLMDIRRGALDVKRMVQLGRCAGRIGESPIYLDETASITISQLRSKCRRLAHSHGIKLVVIDYLQLMGSTRNYENKATEIGEISKGLKAIAREFNVPVIALSQLNRGVEARTDKRPMMSDLRESGAIEQDADVIAFLYREEYYLRDKTPKDRVGLAEVIIAKNRNGPTGSFLLNFTHNIARFESLTGRRDIPE